MIYKEMSHQLFLCQNISSDFKISLITPEIAQAAQLILNAPRLFWLVSIPVDTPTFGINIMGTQYAIKPTYANLKAELLQSDKNQIALPDKIALVNVVSSSSVPEPTLPISLYDDIYGPTKSSTYATSTSSMRGRMKSTHQAFGCTNFCVICTACALVRHKLVFCRKVIALKKSPTSSSRVQRQSKNKDNKTKQKRVIF